MFAPLIMHALIRPFLQALKAMMKKVYEIEEEDVVGNSQFDEADAWCTWRGWLSRYGVSKDPRLL